MRMKGKKPVFNRADTFSLRCTLSPIIKAGLIKYKEVVQTSDITSGVSCKFISIMREMGYIIDSSIPNDWYDNDPDDINHKKVSQLWYEVLDKMILAFGESDLPLPDGLHFKCLPIDPITHEILDPNYDALDPANPNTDAFYDKETDCHGPFTMQATNQALYDQYKIDEREYHAKREEGLKLFATFYDDLWW